MAGKGQRLLATLWVVAAAACSSGGDGRGDVLVMAAASLHGPMEEVSTAFEADTGIPVAVSYGGSQALAQQIASGAPAALFLSAGVSPVAFLEERVELAGEPAHVLGNRLVLVVPAGGGEHPDGIAGLANERVGRIALADPAVSPAGRYARESLERLGLWDDLLPKMVFAADVRAALAYVESGNADAAFVYATDAASSPSVTVAAEAPHDSHSPIVYPAAVITGSGREDAASRLVEYLRGARAREIFKAYGFTAAE